MSAVLTPDSAEDPGHRASPPSQNPECRVESSRTFTLPRRAGAPVAFPAAGAVGDGPERSVEHYSYQIKLGFAGDYWFRSSIVCPMDESELELAVIQEAGVPNKKAGDKIWGVLVFDQKLADYRLD